MSEVYSHGHHHSVVASHARRGVADSAAYLLPHLRDGMSILDVGCGPGSITVELARRFPHSRVLGVDASADVVEQAGARAADEGVRNAEFCVGDAYALDAADGEFDVVHAHQVLQHLSRPVDALREFRRVKAHDGLVAVRDVDYEGITWFPQSSALSDWLDVYLRLARRNGGEPAAARHLRGWAKAAGFGSVHVTGSAWTYASDEQVRTWGDTWTKRAVESEFARQAVDYGLAGDDDLRVIAAGWAEWASSPDAWFQLPHGEVIARD